MLAKETVAECVTKAAARLGNLSPDEMADKLDRPLNVLMAIALAAEMTSHYDVSVSVTGPITLRKFIAQVEALVANPVLAHN